MPPEACYQTGQDLRPVLSQKFLYLIYSGSHIQETHTDWGNIIQEVLRELRSDPDPTPEIE